MPTLFLTVLFIMLTVWNLQENPYKKDKETKSPKMLKQNK